MKNYYTFIILLLSIITLWIPKVKIKEIPLWILLLSLAIIVGLFTNIVDLISLPSIFLLGFSYFIFKNSKSKYIRIFSCICFSFIALAFGLHLFPGFHNIPIIKNEIISKNAIPYSLYLNFDKALVGLFILGFGHSLEITKEEFFKKTKCLILPLIFTITFVICIAYLINYIKLDIKLNTYILIWMLSNLFISCLSEEAFFRGFIQKEIQDQTGSASISIVISSLLFGIAHFAGGIKYIILATIAGIGYGLSYHITKRIEGAIITHFSLNLIHYIFFTYPALG